MRKIEEQMIAAIREKRNWTHGKNAKGYHAMQVIYDRAQGEFFIDVYLHANHIASVDPSTGEVTPNLHTFRAYPTATTRSRLRALGVDASIKNFAPQINGEYI